MKTRFLRLLSLSLGLAIFLPTAGRAQDQDAVRSTLHQFHAALSAGDSVTALAQLAPDLRILEGGGIETLEQYRSHHLPGDMAFAAGITRESGEISVEIRGDVAWAYSTSTSKGTIRGRDIDRKGAELAVLIRVDGVWKIVAIQWS
jgi:ketosteroid isomerase-like protein